MDVILFKIVAFFIALITGIKDYVVSYRSLLVACDNKKTHVIYEFLERAERENVVQQPKTYKSQHEQNCYITDIIEVL